MPVSGDSVEGGVQETDDGNRTFVLGEAEGLHSVQGLQGGDGARVVGRAHADIAW